MVIFKGIFHPKMKIFSKFPYSQDIHDVNEFVSSLGQLWRNFALLY